MTIATSDPELLQHIQYHAAPAAGLQRFWMRFATWAEDWPETPFFFWQTASGCNYKIKASVEARITAGEFTRAQIETLCREGADGTEASLNAMHEQYMIGDAYLCALIDAPNAAAAITAVRRLFPDLEVSFCDPAPNKTLDTLAQSGRLAPVLEPCEPTEEPPAAPAG